MRLPHAHAIPLAIREEIEAESRTSSRRRPGARATSTELTGGAGFTYEDTVVAYYPAALLREDRAAGQSGVVVSVAVQQSGNGHPMDDLVVEFQDSADRRLLALQVKRSLRITANNEDFREIMAAADATRNAAAFGESYVYGFATEQVAVDRFRGLIASSSGPRPARTRTILSGGLPTKELPPP